MASVLFTTFKSLQAYILTFRLFPFSVYNIVVYLTIALTLILYCY